MHALPRPVVLLRYYSIANELQIFPIELLEGTYKSNRSSLDHKLTTSVNYVNLLFEGKFVTAVGKMQCEVVYYLYPPNENKSPNMYDYVNWSRNRVLKNPFFIENDRSDWKWKLLSTTPKLSLLICKTAQGYICENDHDNGLNGLSLCCMGTNKLDSKMSFK